MLVYGKNVVSELLKSKTNSIKVSTIKTLN